MNKMEEKIKMAQIKKIRSYITIVLGVVILAFIYFLTCTELSNYDVMRFFDDRAGVKIESCKEYAMKFDRIFYEGEKKTYVDYCEFRRFGTELDAKDYLYEFIADSHYLYDDLDFSCLDSPEYEGGKLYVYQNNNVVVLTYKANHISEDDFRTNLKYIVKLFEKE